jgi:flagellar motility protein MotE (MotC chaperone)
MAVSLNQQRDQSGENDMTDASRQQAGRTRRTQTRPARARRRRAAGRGTLGLLATLLLVSGGLRLVEGTGGEIRDGLRAFAASGTDAEASELGAASQDARPSPDALLAALAEREAELDRREAALADRERAVAIAEERIAANLDAMEEAERRLRETIALADGAAADDLARLTRMYETMKPKEAAALFETMDPNFAAGFLGQMRPDAAAAVLAGLTPETAYTISLVLAGRNMRVPTE